ncbi:MAG: OmpA family protein [Saprospiraceae bacterium]|nr:OmpA family protein [Saprospiraceae bacterium]
MTRKFIITYSLMATMIASAVAQNAAQSASSAKYKLFASSDQTEVGVLLGVSTILGDFAVKPGVGLGVHVRKALDYTFSLRADLGFTALPSTATAGYTYGGPGGKGIMKGANTNLLSGALQLVASLNNGRWDGGVRNINPYVFGGGGLAYTNTTIDIASGPAGTVLGSQEFVTTANKIAPTIEMGAGIAFRVSDKMNVAIEQKIFNLYGRRGDLLDAYAFRARDFGSLTNLRLNFNIGAGTGKDKKTLPLWWSNAAEQTQAEIAELKARPKLDLTDTDGDGIIDMIDQEKETPAGARVDTRGVALDSDADGYADYKDKEPYSPVGFKVDNNGVAMVPKPAYVTEADVDRIVEGKLAKFKATLGDLTVNSTPSMSDWFLPMIHYDLNSATVKSSEYGNLSAVASVLKSNPSVRIAVTGFTDKTASDGYNDGLSYRRAQNAIDALVKQFGVDRSRLVLTYQGEGNTLVPTTGVSVMNRRVEFKVATSESEMTAPTKEMKRKSYKGNKSGY